MRGRGRCRGYPSEDAPADVAIPPPRSCRALSAEGGHRRLTVGEQPAGVDSPWSTDWESRLGGFRVSHHEKGMKKDDKKAASDKKAAPKK
jgi:hypothetical protein